MRCPTKLESFQPSDDGLVFLQRPSRTVHGVPLLFEASGKAKIDFVTEMRESILSMLSTIVHFLSKCRGALVQYVEAHPETMTDQHFFIISQSTTREDNQPRTFFFSYPLLSSLSISTNEKSKFPSLGLAGFNVKRLTS